MLGDRVNCSMGGCVLQKPVLMSAGLENMRVRTCREGLTETSKRGTPLKL